MSYYRLARWWTWVVVWLCCTIFGGGLLLGTTAAQAAPAAPAKAASAKEIPPLPGDTGPTTVLSCGGYRHNPGDFASLSYGGYVGYDADGHHCDGSFSYVPTPASSSVTWPVAVNTADPKGTQVDVWTWIPTLNASASVDYTATICRLGTTTCFNAAITQGFNQDPVSGWQYVGATVVSAGTYVSQITMSSGDQQQNNMGESAIGITRQDF